MSSIVGIVIRVAVIAAIAVIQIAWLAQPLPLAVRALHVSLWVVGAFRPVAGLLVVAALTPFVGLIAPFAEVGYPPAKLLEQLVLAGMTGPLMRHWRMPSRTRIGYPAALVSIVAVASAASITPAAFAAAAPGTGAHALLSRFWETGYFDMAPAWEAITLAALTCEAALLGWVVERQVRRTPASLDQLVRMALIGAAGASLVSVLRITAGALRSEGFVQNFLQLFATVRTSVLADPNTTASMLLLPLIAGMGLVAKRHTHRWLYGSMVVVTTMGLWLTGSRVALISAAATLMVAGYPALVRSRDKRVISAIAAGIVIGAAGLVVFYPATRNMDVSRSLESRLVLARAGVEMTRTSPIWGVGIGQFDDRSADLAGPEITRLFGQAADGRWYSRENAHNNFLQVLAEQGIVGLAALLLLLGSVGVPALRDDAGSPLRRWLVFAVGACLLTWLTGHPLLVAEFVFIFWAFLGLLGGTTLAPGKAHEWGRAVALICILATVPMRAEAALRTANLEYRASGLTLWQHDDEIPYRSGGASFSLYVPAAETLAIPVRREPGVPDPLTVDVLLDGRLINSVNVGGDQWGVLRFPLRGERRHFVLLEFRVVNAPPSETRLIRVGKPSS